MLRIISGKYRSRQISSPKNIRPTKDNVREAVFNVIAGAIKGARVLDLFAGSGSFGIEALSRAASGVVFVDNNRISIRIIEKNLKKIASQDLHRVKVLTQGVQGSIRSLHKQNERFDIVFLDPPYYKLWIKKCLKYLSVYDILTSSGLIIAEHFKKDESPYQLQPFERIRQLRYGDTTISIYQKELRNE